MQSITVKELHENLSNAPSNMILIDVREPFEHEEYNIGGTLIPLSEISAAVNKIPIDKKVIVYCRKGIRSQVAIQRLQEKFPFTNLVNLIGGTEAWKKYMESINK